MGEKKQISLSLPRGITIRQYKNCSTLVVTFTYKGVAENPYPGWKLTQRGLSMLNGF